MIHHTLHPHDPTTRHFLDVIKNHWLATGVVPEECDAFIDTQIQHMLTGVIQGITLTDTGPLGIMWVHRQSSEYGSVFVHALPEAIPHVIEAFVASGVARGVMMELSQLVPDPQVGLAMEAAGFFALPRQSMVAPLSGITPPTLSPDDAIVPLGPAHHDTIARISWPAHQYSNDYPHYAPLSSYENRLRMDREVWQGIYGAVIPEASLMWVHRGIPVAICEMVTCPFWQQPDFPWVFDIATHVDHMGHHHGQRLLQACMHRLWDLGHNMIGLSVTQSNRGAIRVYDGLGFGIEETRCEYIHLPPPRPSPKKCIG